MKKIILLIIPIILITGCMKKEEVFEKTAKEYYNNHMKFINEPDKVTITLEDLMNAKEEDGYNIKKIEKCDKSSKIIFNVEKETKNIKKDKIELKC
jgi:hypothetical protein